MNGIGVCLAVGLGTMIGLRIVTPSAPFIEYVATFTFYGGLSGLFFELYRFAFTATHPFRR